jgi:6-phosphofructokinase 1
VRAIAEGAFNHMVAYVPPAVDRIPFDQVVGKMRSVPLDSGVILTARHLGISFGD